MVHADVATGVCENRQNQSSRCHYAFPPLFSLHDLVGMSFKDPKEPTAAAVISGWDQSLAANSFSFDALARYQKSHTSFVNLSRGAAAATILSLLFSFAFLITYIILNRDVAKVYTTDTYNTVPGPKYFVIIVEGKYQDVRSGKVIEIGTGDRVELLRVEERTEELKLKGEVYVVQTQDKVESQKHYHWRFTDWILMMVAVGVVDFLLVLAALLCFVNAMAAGPGAFNDTDTAGKIVIILTIVGKILGVPVAGGILLAFAIVLGFLILACVCNCIEDW